MTRMWGRRKNGICPTRFPDRLRCRLHTRQKCPGFMTRDSTMWSGTAAALTDGHWNKGSASSFILGPAITRQRSGSMGNGPGPMWADIPPFPLKSRTCSGMGRMSWWYGPRTIRRTWNSPGESSSGNRNPHPFSIHAQPESGRPCGLNQWKASSSARCG